MNLYNSAKAQAYSRNTILISLEGKQLSITKSSFLQKNPEWLNSFPSCKKKKGILLLSSPEQQLLVKHSPGLAEHPGSGTLPCPLPPGWWPWQHSQSSLAKSFSRNPSLSLASALGQERRHKGHLKRVPGMPITPSNCSPAIVLFPQDPALSHPFVTQGYSHKQPGALWEVRPFLTTGI